MLPQKAVVLPGYLLGVFRFIFVNHEVVCFYLRGVIPMSNRLVISLRLEFGYARKCMPSDMRNFEHVRSGVPVNRFQKGMSRYQRERFTGVG